MVHPSDPVTLRGTVAPTKHPLLHPISFVSVSFEGSTGAAAPQYSTPGYLSTCSCPRGIVLLLLHCNIVVEWLDKREIELICRHRGLRIDADHHPCYSYCCWQANHPSYFHFTTEVWSLQAVPKRSRDNSTTEEWAANPPEIANDV